jgi:DNA-binding transcriptional MocR family regulator
MGERLPSRRTVWLHAVNASGLPAPARHVALVIGCHMNPEAADADPSIRALVDETGLSNGTVNTYLPKLEAVGLLVIEHGGNHIRNRYTGRIPDAILPKLHPKQSRGWTVSGGNVSTSARNVPTAGRQTLQPLDTKYPRSSPIEGASRFGEEGPEPDLDGWTAAAAANPGSYRRRHA